MNASRLLAGLVLSVSFLSTPFTYASAPSKADDTPRSGDGLTIWFDTGGPAGGSYNTVVQNGAAQACRDLNCDIKFVYSDWSPQKMVEK